MQCVPETQAKRLCLLAGTRPIHDLATMNEYLSMNNEMKIIEPKCGNVGARECGFASWVKEVKIGDSYMIEVGLVEAASNWNGSHGYSFDCPQVVISGPSTGMIEQYRKALKRLISISHLAFMVYECDNVFIYIYI